MKNKVRVELRNVKILYEIHKLKNLGFDFILLKGLHFAKFYGEIEKRKIKDIDIFVREAEVPKVVENLKKEGYYQKYQPNILECKMDVYHKSNFPIEIHWKITNPLYFDIGEDDLWLNTTLNNLFGIEIRTLNEIFSLFHAILHFHFHLFRKRELSDILHIVKHVEKQNKNYIEDLFSISKRYRAGFITYLSFDLLHRIFGFDNGYKKYFSPDMLQKYLMRIALVLAEEKYRIKNNYYKLITRGLFCDNKLLFMKKLLKYTFLPPKGLMRQRYGKADIKAYILRPFVIISKLANISGRNQDKK